jgi:hypothetical protein
MKRWALSLPAEVSRKDKALLYTADAHQKQGTSGNYLGSPISRQPTTARKRDCHHCSGDQKSADGSGGDGRKRQRRVPHATDDRVHGAVRLLACPFYKYDFRRYSEFNRLEKEYRVCSGVYMTSITRLK